MSLRNYITLNQISKSRYDLTFENGTSIGSFMMLEDGYFYWFPDIYNNGCYSDYIIKEIYEKLIELNKKEFLK